MTSGTMRLFNNVITVTILIVLIADYFTLVNGDGNVFDGFKKRLNWKGAADSSSEGGNTNDVQIESSTGTIPVAPTPDDDIDDSSKAAANTCDDILVLNLARANEKAQRAEQQRDVALENESAALDRITVLEIEIAKLQSTLAEERDQHAKIEAEAKLTIATIEAVSEQKLSDQKQEANRHLLEQTKKLTSAMDQLDQEKNDVIASLRSKLEMASEDLQRKLQEEVEQVRQDRDQRLAEMKRQMDDAVAAAESDRDTKVAELTASMAKAAEKAAQELNEQADKMKKDYDAVVKQKDDLIKQSQNYAQQLLKEMEGKDQSLNNAESELLHWRELYSNRTYCNMTMIKEDLYDAATNLYDAGKEAADHGILLATDWTAQGIVLAKDWTAQGIVLAKDAGSKFQVHSEHHYAVFLHHATIGLQKARELAIVGAQSAGELYREQMEHFWPIIKPIYEEQIVQNYNRHIEPHVQKHLRPHYEQAKTWYQNDAEPTISKLHSNISKQCSIAFIDASVWYGHTCNTALQSYRASMRDVEVLKRMPTSVLKIWKDSCSHPDESLEAAIKGFMVILALLFWRPIFNLTMWMFGFVTSVILTITPLGFIIPRRSSRRRGQKKVDEIMPDKVISQNGTMMSPLQTRGQRREAKSAVKVKKESAQ